MPVASTHALPDPAFAVAPIDPFATDYELDSRRVIRPRGRDFELIITPRFEHHFVVEAYEALTADLLGSLLTSRELFVDVGAHSGFFTLLAATRHPAVHVIALEPVAENHALLVEGIERNGLTDRVEALLVAASDREGQTRLFVSQASDNCSLYPHPSTATIDTRAVPATSLDRLLAGRAGARRAIVKIDTDGHEMAVLDGLAATMESAEDLRLFVELNPKMQRLAGHTPEGLVSRLHSLGFEVFLIDDRRRRFIRLVEPGNWRLGCDEWSYANLYCVPRERALAIAAFSHSSRLAGAERTLLGNLAMSIEDRGAVCTVVLPEDGPLRSRLEGLGAATLIAPLPLWCAFEPKARIDPEREFAVGCECFARTVLPALAEAAPDLVESMTLTIPWGAVASEVLGIPHVWQVCEHGEADHGLAFFHPFDQVRSAIARHSDLVLVASETVRRRLFADLPDRRAVTMDRWIPLTAPARGRDGAPTRSARLLLIGTVFAGKDQKTVVEALGHLRDRGFDADLLLAGATESRYLASVRETAAAAGVAERVHLLGFVEPVADLLVDADVVVSAARHEAFGRSAFEAAAAGVPVVFARGSGPADVLQDGVHGLAFEPGNAADLASKVALLLAQPDLAARLGRDAQLLVEARFNRRRVEETRHALLAETMEAGSVADPVSRLVLATQSILRRDVVRLRSEARRLNAELDDAVAALARAEVKTRAAEQAGERWLQERADLEARVAATASRARAWEGLAADLEAERAWMSASLSWRLRARLLAVPGAAALHRTLRRAIRRLNRRPRAAQPGSPRLP